jgi:hypothetical protein
MVDSSWEWVSYGTSEAAVPARVRRDNVSRLVMSGGANDVLIEETVRGGGWESAYVCTGRGPSASAQRDLSVRVALASPPISHASPHGTDPMRAPRNRSRLPSPRRAAAQRPSAEHRGPCPPCQTEALFAPPQQTMPSEQRH